MTNCNITSVGNYAFRFCSNVKEIKIGKQVMNLGTAPFDTRCSIDKITVEDGNPNFLVENGILKSTDGILYRADSTFDGIIPSDITNIQIYALSYSDMTSIVIPTNVKTLGTYACAYCNNLVYAEFNAGVTSISARTGNRVFGYCSNLKYVKVKSNLTAISTMVIQCISLEVLDFSEMTSTTVPTCTATSFTNVPDGLKVVVPDALYDAWSTTTSWTTHINSGKIILVKASEFTGSKDDYL